MRTNRLFKSSLLGTLFVGLLISCFSISINPLAAESSATVTSVTVQKSSSKPAAPAAQTKPAKVSGGVGQSVAKSAVKTQNPVALPVPVACVPAQTSTAISAQSNKGPGLHITPTVSSYQVHGYDEDQIRSQINTCGPRINNERFAASTSYTLYSSYDFTVTQTGLCSVSNVRVVTTIHELYPSWNDSESTSAIGRHWQGFLANVTTHERLHAQMYASGAQDIYNSLVHFQATDCSTIEIRVRESVQASLNTLDRDNEHYDAATQHGATQGAIL